MSFALGEKLVESLSTKSSLIELLAWREVQSSNFKKGQHEDDIDRFDRDRFYHQVGEFETHRQERFQMERDRRLT